MPARSLIEQAERRDGQHGAGVEGGGEQECEGVHVSCSILLATIERDEGGVCRSVRRPISVLDRHTPPSPGTTEPHAECNAEALAQRRPGGLGEHGYRAAHSPARQPALRSDV